jgi:threonine-phosphate decarboxylase
MNNFKHGGDINDFALNRKCQIDEVIDLSSNINFVTPDISIDFNNITINSYPTYDQLYNSISNYFDINVEQLELFNGGSSAIFSLMKYFKQKNCYIYSPAYLEYKKAALINNKNVELINRFIELDKKIEKNSIVIFVNPSTPDGTFYNMKELLNYWKNQNCTVIVDESFLEFTLNKSVSQYLNEFNNLYILKSMTKFFSCAGIRVGCIISQKQNIEKLKQNEPLWKISNYDSLILQEFIKDKKFRKISLAVNAKAKAILEQTIKEFNIFEFTAISSVNFILVKLKYINAKQFQEKLQPFKIMIRDCSNFDFLSDEYVRIAVKSQKDMIKFNKAVKQIVS